MCAESKFTAIAWGTTEIAAHQFTVLLFFIASFQLKKHRKIKRRREEKNVSFPID